MTITKNDLDNEDITENVTIPNGDSISGILDLKGFTLKGLILPAAWTAATLTLQVSTDGTNFVPYSSVGTAQNVLSNMTFLGSYMPVVNLTNTMPWTPFPRYIKLRSGTDAAAVNQGADRVFTAVLCPDIWRKP